MFANLLARYGAKLDDTMQEIIAQFETAPPTLQTMIRYPMGWVNEEGTHYAHATGKRVRPLVLLACAEAAGGDWQPALPAAAAVEILHNFSLVHDDIQDASDLRHGRQTVWRVWGVPQAINTGDAMFALSYSAMQQLSNQSLSPTTVLAAWKIYNHTVLELTRGQYMDMAFEARSDVSVDEYLSMIGGKTAALLSACAQLGALVGSEDLETASLYATFGLNVGLAFQVRDDILGIWGDAKTIGKSTATDILAKKKSVPILFGLQNSKAFQDLYTKPTLTEDDVQAGVEILNDIGARAYAQEIETRYTDQALAALNQAHPTTEGQATLVNIVQTLLQRAF